MHLRHLALKSLNHLPAIGCLVIVLLTGMAASTRLNIPSTDWNSIDTHHSTLPLSEASFLLTERHRALIWQPDSAAPFALQSLDAPETNIDLLLYGDIAPSTWQSIPAQADSFHVVWIDSGARLRSALIHTSGDTLRGPVELSSRVGQQLNVIPTGDGGARVFWRAPSERQINTLVLDAEGRPGPTLTLPPRDVDYFAAAADTNNTVHLLWLSPLEANTWIIHYQTLENNVDADTITDIPNQPIHTLRLDPAESITTFALGLDRSWGYVTFAIRDAAQPTGEHVKTLSFALANPENTLINNILLPTIYTGKNQIPENTRLGLSLAALAEPDDENIAVLRWPRPIESQHDDFALAVTHRDQDTWQPAIVFFSDGIPVGYHQITETTADAGPPTLDRDVDGNWYITWAGLDHAQAQRHITTTESTTTTTNNSSSSTSLDRRGWLMQTLAGLVVGSIFSLTWIVAPALVLLLAPPNPWTPTLICALYSMSKLLWPPPLFAEIPPLLAANLFDAFTARLLVGTTVAVITGLALVGMEVARKRSQRTLWQHWLAFLLIDASLTWLIFGPNIVA